MKINRKHHRTQWRMDSTSLFGGHCIPDRDERQYICAWNAALF